MICALLLQLEGVSALIANIALANRPAAAQGVSDDDRTFVGRSANSAHLAKSSLEELQCRLCT